jgi:hypothetical protein
MSEYYKIIGPREFKEDIPSKVWITMGIWAQKTIVAYATTQDPGKPGKLFKIIWKPATAPKDVTRLRMPEDWVISIPNLNVIEKEFSEQWTVVKGTDGILNVVKW